MLTFKRMINILDGNLKPYEKIQKLFFLKSFREYDSGKSKLCLKTIVLASWLSDRTGFLIGWGDQPSKECSCKRPQGRKIGGSRKSERHGPLREKRSEKPVSQNGPRSTCGVVGAGLVRPRAQACSLKPGAPLWLLTLHLSCLTKVYTVRGPAQVTSLHLSQNPSLLI